MPHQNQIKQNNNNFKNQQTTNPTSVGASKIFEAIRHFGKYWLEVSRIRYNKLNWEVFWELPMKESSSAVSPPRQHSEGGWGLKAQQVPFHSAPISFISPWPTLTAVTKSHSQACWTVTSLEFQAWEFLKSSCLAQSCAERSRGCPHRDPLLGSVGGWRGQAQAPHQQSLSPRICLSVSKSQGVLKPKRIAGADIWFQHQVIKKKKKKKKKGKKEGKVC